MSEHDERVEALAKVIAEAWGTDIDLPPECDPYDEAPDYFDDVARHLLDSPAMRDLLAAERAKALREAAGLASARSTSAWDEALRVMDTLADAEHPATPPADDASTPASERRWRDPQTGALGPIHDPVCAALSYDDEDSCSCGALDDAASAPASEGRAVLPTRTCMDGCRELGRTVPCRRECIPASTPDPTAGECCQYAPKSGPCPAHDGPNDSTPASEPEDGVFGSQDIAVALGGRGPDDDASEPLTEAEARTLGIAWFGAGSPEEMHPAVERIIAARVAEAEAKARAGERERIAQAIEARRVPRRRDNTQAQIDTRATLNLAAHIARSGA